MNEYQYLNDNFPACETLGIDADSVTKWKAMLARTFARINKLTWSMQERTREMLTVNCTCRKKNQWKFIWN